jgi:hypothetical protein
MILLTFCRSKIKIKEQLKNLRPSPCYSRNLISCPISPYINFRYSANSALTIFCSTWDEGSAGMGWITRNVKASKW